MLSVIVCSYLSQKKNTQKSLAQTVNTVIEPGNRGASAVMDSTRELPRELPSQRSTTITPQHISEHFAQAQHYATMDASTEITGIPQVMEANARMKPVIDLELLLTVGEVWLVSEDYKSSHLPHNFWAEDHVFSPAVSQQLEKDLDW